MKKLVEPNELPLWRSVSLGAFGIVMAAILTAVAIDQRDSFLKFALGCFAFAAPVLGYVAMSLHHISESNFTRLKPVSYTLLTACLVLGILTALAGYVALMLRVSVWIQFVAIGGLLLGAVLGICFVLEQRRK